MRFALRNQNKIIEVKGEPFLQRLKLALKNYQQIEKELVIYGKVNERFTILVESFKPKETHEIVIVKSMLYDVIQVAYYQTLEK